MNSGDLENPELVGEYLASLQTQIDALKDRNEKLEDRIEHLERDREKLRAKSSKGWRRPAPKTPPPEQVDNSLKLPEVGVIDDVGLPDGPIARPNLVVGVILDEFSRAAFGYEFAAVDVPAIGWEGLLQENPPDLLLVESAYRGDGSWAGRIARFGRPSQHLVELTDWCRDRGIPTVFWNKEDPINHDWFTASAKLFDWVFTVDSKMLDVYAKRLGHNRVDVLPFAAQPVIHHPGDRPERARRIAFAGSYYASKHPERRQQMEMILKPARTVGLDIFDRMDRQDDPRFAWPSEYRAHIRGSLTYPQTLEAYRRYATFINVNTVTDSPTMCARRVYELLASGSQVVSGPSEALKGVPVTVVKNEAAASDALHASLSAGENVDGLAWVLDGNTMSDRVDSILERL